MAKTKQPSAKMGDTIDGDAVEKPTGQTTPPHASESKDSQTASTSLNGWIYWEVKRSEDEGWVLMDSLRSKDNKDGDLIEL